LRSLIHADRARTGKRDARGLAGNADRNTAAEPVVRRDGEVIESSRISRCYSLHRGIVRQSETGSRRASATRKSKGCDPRAPGVAVGRLILVRVPEGTIVRGIQGHAAVIAPACVTGLRTGGNARHDIVLAIHQARGVRRHPARVTDCGAQTAAGNAVPHGNVAVLSWAMLGIRR
jgi:hypothetical protein